MSTEIVVKMPTDLSNVADDQLENVRDEIRGHYQPIDLLIELSPEPPCPHHTVDQVVTDIPSIMWGACLRRVGKKLGLDKSDRPVCIKRKNNVGNYYRTDIWDAVHEPISTLVAKKARRMRGPVRFEDITDGEWDQIMSLSGLS